MPFEKIKGFPGKIYVPEPDLWNNKKHKCLDCFSCDRCSDDRCGVCRAEEKNAERKTNLKLNNLSSSLLFSP